jgi:hypothetical protein
MPNEKDQRSRATGIRMQPTQSRGVAASACSLGLGPACDARQPQKKCSSCLESSYIEYPEFPTREEKIISQFTPTCMCPEMVRRFNCVKRRTISWHITLETLSSAFSNPE